MRRTLLALACAVSVALAAIPTVSADPGGPRQYVPFIGRSVPRSALETRVYATDVSFRDYGAVAARKGFGLRGRGVEICVIDTGADPAHEQLDSRIVAFKDFGHNRFSDWEPRTKVYDDHGHGTHVASIALGDGRGDSRRVRRLGGIARGATLSVAKVLGANGSGSAAQVIGGIEWCAERESVDVISMSLSTRVPSDGTDPISAAVNEAVNMGKVVVVAAGNSGPEPGTMGSPSAAANAITVGASSGWSGDDRGPFLAPWSNRGTTASKPDIIAPGWTVLAASAHDGAAVPGTHGGYHKWSGTSMAAPFVAGVAALMLEANPSFTPQQVKDTLAATALDLGAPGRDQDWGAGLVNAYSAVAAAAGQPGQDIFPPHVTIRGEIQPGRTFYHTFVPTDLGQPVAATIILDHGSDEFAWNVNATLRAPDGETIDVTTCPNDRPCGVGASGRQETIAARPTILPDPNGETAAPWYTLTVFPDTISTPHETRGGTFTVDVFWR